jgi:hypothetical protein
MNTNCVGFKSAFCSPTVPSLHISLWSPTQKSISKRERRQTEYKLITDGNGGRQVERRVNSLPGPTLGSEQKHTARHQTLASHFTGQSRLSLLFFITNWIWGRKDRGISEQTEYMTLESVKGILLTRLTLYFHRNSLQQRISLQDVAYNQFFCEIFEAGDLRQQLAQFGNIVNMFQIR